MLAARNGDQCAQCPAVSEPQHAPPSAYADADADITQVRTACVLPVQILVKAFGSYYASLLLLCPELYITFSFAVKVPIDIHADQQPSLMASTGTDFSSYGHRALQDDHTQPPAVTSLRARACTGRFSWDPADECPVLKMPEPDECLTKV
jgi:hypothetical protein